MHRKKQEPFRATLNKSSVLRILLYALRETELRLIGTQVLCSIEYLVYNCVLRHCIVWTKH